MQSVKYYIDLCKENDLQMFALSEYRSMIQKIVNKSSQLDFDLQENEDNICRYLNGICDQVLYIFGKIRDEYACGNETGLIMHWPINYADYDYNSVVIASIVINVLLERFSGMIMNEHLVIQYCNVDVTEKDNKCVVTFSIEAKKQHFFEAIEEL